MNSSFKHELLVAVIYQYQSDVQNQPNVFKTPYRAVFSSFNVSFTGHFIEKNTEVVNMRTAQKEMSSHVYFYNGLRKIHFSVNTLHNLIGLYPCNPDSVCVFMTLSVLASDSIFGKWTQRREGVNKKEKIM